MTSRIFFVARMLEIIVRMEIKSTYKLFTKLNATAAIPAKYTRKK